MVIDHRYWPVISVIGAAIYLDAAGREAAKNLSFQHEGVKIGTKKEWRVFFSTYIVMALIAIITIIYSIPPLLSTL